MYISLLSNPYLDHNRTQLLVQEDTNVWVSFAKRRYTMAFLWASFILFFTVPDLLINSIDPFEVPKAKRVKLSFKESITSKQVIY